MKKTIFISIFISQSIFLFAQTFKDSLNIQNHEIIHVNNLNLDTKSLSLFKPGNKNANIYYGLANKNSIDFCAVNDSCMLIHDVENNTFILIGANNIVLDQFNYFKKIRGLKKVLPGSPFCGANGNISFINDSTVFVSTIKKGSNFCLLYLIIKNNKIIPIIERLDKYPEFFDDKITESPVWRVFNVFKTNDIFIVSYSKVQSFSDSLQTKPIIYNEKYREGVFGKNFITNDTMRIVKSNNSKTINYSICSFNNTYLITEEFTGNIYQYGENLKFIDSLNIDKYLKKRNRMVNIIKDAITKNTYVTVMTYNKQNKIYCFDIFQLIGNLDLKFYKHLSFERETYIKAINNNKIFFPYVNSDDFKYYIYNVDLAATRKDSLFVTYGKIKPPKLEVNIYNTQSNLIITGNDNSLDLSKDDFTKMKKKERKLLSEIEQNKLKYPQSTIKEVIQSIIKTIDSCDIYYLEQYLFMFEKDYYKQKYEKNRDSLKIGIDNKISLLKKGEFDEMKQLLIHLLSNIEDAYIDENNGLTTIEITEENITYKFIFIKSENEYFMNNLFYTKKKK